MENKFLIKYRLFIKNNRFINKIYWKYLYCPAVVQAKLDLFSKEPISPFPEYYLLEISTESDLFAKYVDFINTSYNEKIYSVEELKNLLLNHYYLEHVKTFVLLDDSKNEKQIVASISIGVYKHQTINNLWGGVVKFAVNKNIRNRGLGSYILSIGYHYLYKRGCLFGESIISDRESRVSSLMTHFKVGFTPQTNCKNVQYSVCKRRTSSLKRYFTNRWLMKYYHIYQKKHKIQK